MSQEIAIGDRQTAPPRGCWEVRLHDVGAFLWVSSSSLRAALLSLGEWLRDAPGFDIRRMTEAEAQALMVRESEGAEAVPLASAPLGAVFS